MYNRYIPQPDGSYRRNRIQEPPDPRRTPPPPPRRSEPPSAPPREEACEEHSPPPCGQEPAKPFSCPRRQVRPPQHRKAPPQAPPCDTGSGSVGGFLRNLLPGDFDTGDLLIVLLLLLMAGDCREDQNTALLTLALYLFM